MSEDGKQLAIGAVAERSGMSTSRIRYYEARGLLPTPERVSGKRATSVRRLLEICSECDCESIDVCRMFDLTSTRVEV